MEVRSKRASRALFVKESGLYPASKVASSKDFKLGMTRSDLHTGEATQNDFFFLYSKQAAFFEA